MKLLKLIFLKIFWQKPFSPKFAYDRSILECVTVGRNNGSQKFLYIDFEAEQYAYYYKNILGIV